MKPRSFVAPLCLALGFAAATSAQTPGVLPVISENATMADKLGEYADLDQRFLDEAGNEVALRDLVSGERPIVLNLGYFDCPRACGPIYNALVDCMQNSELVPGQHLDILTVSIEEAEGPELAAKKREAFIKALGIPEAKDHWRFLTTDDPKRIRALSDSVGYRFERLPNSPEIDHPPTVVLLAADGKVTRYLNGLIMTPVTFRRAIIEAGEGEVGSFLERILVSCLTFDTSSSAYGVTAMTIMRIAGAITVVALGTMIFVLWRRERRTRPAVVAT